MKKLYFVPIIHMSTDMGSVASALEKGAIVAIGQELWENHKKTVAGFWDSIARFFYSLNVGGFKIYQDGLVVNGTDALRIVKEDANQGSKNYEIIENLLERGAVLIKTEDLALVREEYSNITKITSSRFLKDKKAAALRYKLAQSKLLRQRDEFIVRRIKETLGEGETGILFIGAYHDILPKLPDDLQVSQVKDIAMVREYQALLTTTKGHNQHFQQLAEYLTSPITNLPFN